VVTKQGSHSSQDKRISSRSASRVIIIMDDQLASSSSSPPTALEETEMEGSKDLQPLMLTSKKDHANEGESKQNNILCRILHSYRLQQCLKTIVVVGAAVALMLVVTGECSDIFIAVFFLGCLLSFQSRSSRLTVVAVCAMPP
jgi:hypothetical protein